MRLNTLWGFPCCVCLPLSYMLSSIPRRNHRLHFARFTYDDGLPRIVAGSASAKFVSRPAQRSLALQPACSPSPFSGPSTPEASAVSLPVRLLQLLPVGAKVTGRDSHPLKNSAFSRRTTVSVRPYHVALSGCFCFIASIRSGAKGSNSSMRLLGQTGSFSRTFFNHSAGFKPLSLAVPSRV